MPPLLPQLILAPMQRVTDYPFMKVMSQYGGADRYVTEYFRVHLHSKLDRTILKSVDQNPTGRPIYAQMIGQDIAALTRSARELMQHPVAGIDLNLGCPAPVVCRKDAGGGLLRNPQKIDVILGALREVVEPPFEFTVKTRLGYESEQEFETLLEVFAKHRLDALAVHGRTVRERYQSAVHPSEVRAAVSSMNCPVHANGNIVDVKTARAYQAQTGAAGLMIGRGAIRNPWLFRQIRESFRGEEVYCPTQREVLRYIEDLWEATASEFSVPYDELKQVHKMKRYLTYISQGIDPGFEYAVRRVKSQVDFFAVCRDFLHSSEAFPPEPNRDSHFFREFAALHAGL